MSHSSLLLLLLRTLQMSTRRSQMARLKLSCLRCMYLYRVSDEAIVDREVPVALLLMGMTMMEAVEAHGHPTMKSEPYSSGGSTEWTPVLMRVRLLVGMAVSCLSGSAYRLDRAITERCC